jgi:hypothetical protein
VSVEKALGCGMVNCRSPGDADELISREAPFVRPPICWLGSFNDVFETAEVLDKERCIPSDVMSTEDAWDGRLSASKPMGLRLKSSSRTESRCVAVAFGLSLESKGSCTVCCTMD